MSKNLMQSNLSDFNKLGNFEKLSDFRMTNLVDANLYRIDGDYAKPNLDYCRPDAPVYHRVELGWQRISGRVRDDLEQE